MRLSHITIQGFKSFSKKTTIDVTHQVTGVVGPNGSGKSNIAEAIRFVLGEQSMKSMRGKIGSDIIFKGSEHLAPMSRASVTMVIDNKEKPNTEHMSETLAAYLIYDELTLARVIYADGTSDYMLNDAKIRLKDVQELLSFAGIGSSAHTIINQGEADRILLASPRDRKEALEDALGLRVYHLRLNESKRKLEKVKTHVHEVELLQKEIKPHLAHLARQVEKIEQEKEERKNLHALLVAYLQREEKEMLQQEDELKEKGTSASLELIVDSVTKELELLEQGGEDTAPLHTQEKETLEQEMRALLERSTHTSKTLGRLEGELSYQEKELARTEEKKDVIIPSDEFIQSHETISHGFEQVHATIHTHDIDKVQSQITDLATISELFFTKYSHGDALKNKKESIREEMERISQLIHDHKEKEVALATEIALLEEKMLLLDTKEKESVVSRHEEEIKILNLKNKLRELHTTIALRKQEEQALASRKEYFEQSLREGVTMLGASLLQYNQLQSLEKYTNLSKHDLTRHIERSKLRIEEAGISNRDEVIAEYTTTKERDEYLAKELADIRESETKLLQLIDELTTTLTDKFSSGVKEVSKVFNDFFAEIFPGGKGTLSLVQTVKINDEGEELTEQGIDLDVMLPNKKVREISMFSGGERALVSIALLFAMSAITPPPFMVLDETDAPLDESNARKYGIMLKRLAEKSKLLVITHNRETMNHCDMLYGVTLGVDGSSKLLSVNFEQAESYAK
jgi:chromosome segregation protein